MFAWLAAITAQLAGFWPAGGHFLAGQAGAAPSAGLMALAAVAFVPLAAGSTC
ncbi:MAG: hypothetical protein ACLQDY_25935 [Streptosporangiaceae bacterium]